MREIKFRAWVETMGDQSFRDWSASERANLYGMNHEERVALFEKSTGNEYQETTYRYMLHSLALSPNGKPMLLEGGWDYQGEDDTAVVMQHTGLKDNNGVEIYEGDIVKLSMDNWVSGNGEMHTLETVSYSTEFAGFLPFVEPYDYQESVLEVHKNSIEVIGNIYENPELLEN